MKPCLSEIAFLATTFAEDVNGCADGGFPALEVWLTKLDDHLKGSSVSDTRKLLLDRGVSLEAASGQGGLLFSSDAAHRIHLDHFKRRLDICAAFSIPTLVVTADGEESSDLARAVSRLAEAARWADGFGVRLALEFRGTDPACASLSTATALVEACGETNAGVCFDLFHYYQGPSKFEDLDRLTAGNLAHVQICDVAGVPRERMTDSDRLFPGEGDFQIAALIEKLRAIGYAGGVALEVTNHAVRSARVSQVAELGMKSMRAALA